MVKVVRLICILLVISLLATAIVGCTGYLNVSLTRPKDGAVVKTSPVRVNGTVSDKKARVTVNDVEVAVSTYGGFETHVMLNEGQNTITVVATKGKKTASKVVTVTYTPEQ